MTWLGSIKLKSGLTFGWVGLNLEDLLLTFLPVVGVLDLPVTILALAGRTIFFLYFSFNSNGVTPRVFGEFSSESIPLFLISNDLVLIRFS